MVNNDIDAAQREKVKRDIENSIKKRKYHEDLVNLIEQKQKLSPWYNRKRSQQITMQKNDFISPNISAKMISIENEISPFVTSNDG